MLQEAMPSVSVHIEREFTATTYDIRHCCALLERPLTTYILNRCVHLLMKLCISKLHYSLNKWCSVYVYRRK
jgi:hypothetical protein